MPVITINYFFEIQIQLYLVLKKLRRIEKKNKDIYQNLSNIHIRPFLYHRVFPTIFFPITNTIFCKNFSIFLFYFFGFWKKIHTQISLSLGFIFQSNVALLADLVIFKYNFEYMIIMSFFYASKFLFLNGYLNINIMNQRERSIYTGQILSFEN